ncbi:MAG: membrane protein insertion efficiency factor YidD [Candidatus Yanofskybacteria bacterium RIFCSPHIGHO2_01_FULL_39_8b]|uniref:Membrane protein insertion efficiency factor YidD n=1 Tax=Candidatus Yanofskybacteria bacterium RIFCSPHIGHO2_01_FULL_39_8b TaxID=1802659 RepID=A0A1F8EJ51_9BACT|nr:MAG: membrane protein insertion efficiency factor YidD [Candidatus Yanofskybacteria bacterium RIFCSPHIGHO2_01_FULL_39_8b]
MKKILIFIIRAYRQFSGTVFFTPFSLFYSTCLFYPTCSEYAIDSIEKYGFWKGSFRGLIRILKCNPLV